MSSKDLEKARLNSKNYRDKSYLNNLEIAKDYYGYPFKCSHCGFTHKEFVPFDLHHLNPDEKEGTPSQLMKTSTGKFEKEMKKCVLLCANCHRLHHHGDIELNKAESVGDYTFKIKSINDIFAKKLQELYIRSEFNKKEIADLFGLCEVTVSKYTTGLEKKIKPYTQSSNRKLTKEQVLEIRSLFSTMNNAQIARKFGLDPHTIGGIKNGKSYTDWA